MYVYIIIFITKCRIIELVLVFGHNVLLINLLVLLELFYLKQCRHTQYLEKRFHGQNIITMKSRHLRNHFPHIQLQQHQNLK